MNFLFILGFSKKSNLLIRITILIQIFSASKYLFFRFMHQRTKCFTYIIIFILTALQSRHITFPILHTRKASHYSIDLSVFKFHPSNPTLYTLNHCFCTTNCKQVEVALWALALTLSEFIRINSCPPPLLSSTVFYCLIWFSNVPIY